MLTKNIFYRNFKLNYSTQKKKNYKGFERVRKQFQSSL